jgi:3-carboxy-cis,cis-muconate cycloisomerase
MPAPDPQISTLYGPLTATAAMRALTSDRGVIGRMLQVEVALARAEAAAGVIPRTAAKPIAAACDPRRYDAGKIAEAAADAGNLAIPLVKDLTAAVKKRAPEAARWVHWGATSQDIIDTAMALSIVEAQKLLDRDLGRAIRGLAALSRRHRNTPMVARTWLQHALPTTFGFKLAGYAAMIGRVRARLAEAADIAAVVQFGGAVGTLAALGNKGPAVAKRLADALRLGLPDAPWHSAHDRVAGFAAALGIAVGSAGKIARDVALLTQTEVQEVFEPAAPGRGGSSTLPHKRNPVAAAQILTAATLAPGLVADVFAALVQEHERAAGTWQAEWIALPELMRLSSGAFARLAEIAEGLEVDKAKMCANLDLTDGLIMAEAVQMALAAEIGRSAAHDVIGAASKRALKEKRPLVDVLGEIPEVTRAIPKSKLKALANPLSYLGAAELFRTRALAAAERAAKSRRKR